LHAPGAETLDLVRLIAGGADQPRPTGRAAFVVPPHANIYARRLGRPGLAVVKHGAGKWRAHQQGAFRSGHRYPPNPARSAPRRQPWRSGSVRSLTALEDRLDGGDAVLGAVLVVGADDGVEG